MNQALALLQDNLYAITPDLENRLVNAISETLLIEKQFLIPSASFKDDLATDSLDFYEMLTTVEKEFSIKFTEEETENIRTVGDLTKLIQSKH